MKNVLKTLLSLVAILLVTGGYFIYDRYQKNPEQIFPYPYSFQTPASAIKPDAPVLIVGDRMGAYMARFQAELAATISTDLSKPIKIQSTANNGHGLHRTLHEMKALVQWPQIVIYQGGSEEFLELKFNPEHSSIIKKNFSLYQDDRIQTMLILKPSLSRIVYWPHSRIVLGEIPQLLPSIDEKDYFQRLETELLLFEQQLIQLVNLSRDRGSLLILTTTPINLEVSPKKACSFASTLDIEFEIKQLDDLMNANNPKSAYTQSTKLLKQYAGNANLYYKHAQIAKRLGLMDEAKNSFIQASAFDCSPWRATEVFNTVVRRVAKSQQIILFDYAKMVSNDWASGTTFFDEIYPQNLYYEQAMKQLGLLIKQILKL